ncbi:isopenicillin N synthase family oxygenase [Actinoplanes sp. N902-109]|uniref:isopenicillin N synthase family dioxygenase n=1 Tax=Actinoplanes sp. (strain N902-109) TaxID=649831 RepID=UPI0003295F0E|nr:2-oxoglutarate and iron-dependent oxygenase domain-containing protein [Actinoplanes sp. N902-109]AGL12164.1 iron/ascorbate-dependent oxidoreductase [Actinoplanes sp. N902-109]AGL16488.1 iron/ascorbate-dependent oxidoreductase [Actinoplanes sp. N902-109]
MTVTFPVLDLRDATGTPESKATFLNQLRVAIHEIGFFQLIGHGIDDFDKMLELSRQFFALPEQDKLALNILDSPLFRGYSEIGREHTKGIPDHRQQLDIGPEQPERRPAPGDPVYQRMIGPNRWPEAMPELRPAIESWITRLTGLSHRMLRLICESLDAPADFLDDVVDPDPQIHLKLLHYPGPPLTGQDNGSDQGTGIHNDLGLLTLLVRDNNSGLQVAVKDGQFVEVPVLPEAFVVNLGELLEVATNGYVRATLHRVVRPAPGVDRYSIPFFYNPRLNATMQPLPSPYVEAADGVSDVAGNPLFALYGENVMKGMIRSFPEIIARHHPDLAPVAGSTSA